MSRVIRYNTIHIDESNIFTPDVADPLSEVADIALLEEMEEDAEAIRKRLLDQASKEANSIIDSAKIKSVQIVSVAENEAKQRAKEVYDEIKQQAYDEGYEKGEQEAKKIIDRANKELEDAVKEKEQILRNIEPEVVDLMTKILEKLLGDMVKINKQVILGLVRQGMNQATTIGSINVRVSQADFEVTIKAKDEIMAVAKGAENIEIIKDLSLKQSDCIIETPFGNIDCSLEQQFKSIKENLYYILSHRG